MLLLSFAVIFVCAKYSLSLIEVYPQVACDTFPENDSPDEMQRAAIREYSINHALI